MTKPISKTEYLALTANDPVGASRKNKRVEGDVQKQIFSTFFNCMSDKLFYKYLFVVINGSMAIPAQGNTIPQNKSNTWIFRKFINVMCCKFSASLLAHKASEIVSIKNRLSPIGCFYRTSDNHRFTCFPALPKVRIFALLSYSLVYVIAFFRAKLFIFLAKLHCQYFTALLANNFNPLVESLRITANTQFTTPFCDGINLANFAKRLWLYWSGVGCNSFYKSIVIFYLADVMAFSTAISSFFIGTKLNVAFGAFVFNLCISIIRIFFVLELGFIANSHTAFRAVFSAIKLAGLCVKTAFTRRAGFVILFHTDYLHLLFSRSRLRNVRSIRGGFFFLNYSKI